MSEKQKSSAPQKVTPQHSHSQPTSANTPMEDAASVSRLLNVHAPLPSLCAADVLALQRTVGNQVVQRAFIQRMKEKDAKVLYKRANQKTESLQKKKAQQQVAELKQAGGPDWEDYKKHNNLNAEGLPQGNITLGAFGKRQEEKTQASGVEAETVSSGWSQLQKPEFIMLGEFLSGSSILRLKQKYKGGIFEATMSARSEQDIQKIADSIVNDDERNVYKGDIGEVLATSSKSQVGWISISHQFDSTEPSIDVISFAPPPEYHIVLTEVKYWPSKMGIFTLKSLPVIYQKILISEDIKIIKDEIIRILVQRKELSAIFESYMSALHGQNDVLLSWEIEIIGDKNPVFAGEIQDFQRLNVVSIFTHDSVTARLITKAAAPRFTSPASGKLGILEASSKKQKAVHDTEQNVDEEAAVRVLETPSDDQFVATYNDLLAMEKTPLIISIIEAMKPLVEAARQGGYDEPYYFYGRIRG